MQVEWVTLDTLARTKGVDLWLLFPLGQAVNRLLTRKGPPPAYWSSALTRIFGTETWREAFYKPKVQGSLFDPSGGVEKDTNFEAISAFFVERLRTIFPRVAQGNRMVIEIESAS